MRRTSTPPPPTATAHRRRVPRDDGDGDERDARRAAGYAAGERLLPVGVAVGIDVAGLERREPAAEERRRREPRAARAEDARARQDPTPTVSRAPPTWSETISLPSATWSETAPVPPGGRARPERDVVDAGVGERAGVCAARECERCEHTPRRGVARTAGRCQKPVPEHVPPRPQRRVDPRRVRRRRVRDAACGRRRSPLPPARRPRRLRLRTQQRSISSSPEGLPRLASARYCATQSPWPRTLAVPFLALALLLPGGERTRCRAARHERARPLRHDPLPRR